MDKQDSVITFKVNNDLADVIKQIPNRSQFIRAALLAALGGVCPFCEGKGTLNPQQQKQWLCFEERHSIRHCQSCDANHVNCGGSV